jgi:hypothetical protein
MTVHGMHCKASIDINASQEAVYALVSDLSRMGGSGALRTSFVTRPDEGPSVRWTYRLEPSDTGTRVTEVWDVEQLPPAL